MSSSILPWPEKTCPWVRKCDITKKILKHKSWIGCWAWFRWLGSASNPYFIEDVLVKKLWMEHLSGNVNIKDWIDNDLLGKEVTNPNCSGIESSFFSSSKGWSDDDLLGKEVTKSNSSGIGSSSPSDLSSGSVSSTWPTVLQLWTRTETMALDQMLFQIWARTQ